MRFIWLYNFQYKTSFALVNPLQNSNTLTNIEKLFHVVCLFLDHHRNFILRQYWGKSSVGVYKLDSTLTALELSFEYLASVPYLNT